MIHTLSCSFSSLFSHLFIGSSYPSFSQDFSSSNNLHPPHEKWTLFSLRTWQGSLITSSSSSFFFTHTNPVYRWKGFVRSSYKVQSFQPSVRIMKLWERNFVKNPWDEIWGIQLVKSRYDGWPMFELSINLHTFIRSVRPVHGTAQQKSNIYDDKH